MDHPVCNKSPVHLHMDHLDHMSQTQLNMDKPTIRHYYLRRLYPHEPITELGEEFRLWIRIDLSNMPNLGLSREHPHF